MDNTIDDIGHGTHVAGTLAGAPIYGSATYRGIAYNGKISFLDIMTGNNLNIPNLYKVAFSFAANAGVYIYYNRLYKIYHR